jgi:hypothetical protein
MNYICAVYGRTVAPDVDHVEVEVTHKRMEDRDDSESIIFTTAAPGIPSTAGESHTDLAVVEDCTLR